MNKSNHIRNIYIKCGKTFNKNIKKNFHKNNELKEENLPEKNNGIFINNNKLIEQNNSIENKKETQKSKPKEGFPNKKTYQNKNDKNKYINQNMKFLIDNITSEEQSMTNAVNIHNINLINSMNNITVYDTIENKISNIKKDIIKYPLNKFNSQKYNKSKNAISNNNCSLELNTNTNKRANILVNKKRILLGKNNINNIEFNSINKYKNTSLSKKKNPFKELSYKKLNMTENHDKNENKFNNNLCNLSTFNKKENINNITDYKNSEYTTNREIYQEDFSQMKNKNNSMKKRISKDSTSIKTDCSIFNTCSNYNSSLIEEDININKNKMILEKLKNNRKNLINVNKLDIFKINNNSKINNDIENNLSSYNNNVNNNSNLKIPSGSSSNIFSLLSNKNNHNNNNSRFDIENMNAIKKNINNEKLYKTRNKDCFRNNENDNRRAKKTKSEEKNYKKNNDNKTTKAYENSQDLSKKIQLFSSFLNENNQNKNNNKKNELGTIYINEKYNFGKTTSTYTKNPNKLFNPNFNSKNNSKSLSKKQKKKKSLYPNKISYNKDNIQQIKILDPNKAQKENNNNSIFYEKIEVNKKAFTKNALYKSLNKKQINQIIKKTSANIDFGNDSLKDYSKKSKNEPWENYSEQINSFSKNVDNYFYLSNYKMEKGDNNLKNEEDLREKSAPKKGLSTVVYNKKSLLCHIKKGRQKLEDKLLSPDWKQRKRGVREFDLKIDNKKYTEELIENNKINNFEEELSINNNCNEKELMHDISEKDINIINKTYLLKSPPSNIYKKPGINFFNSSKSLIINGKESFNNKLALYTSNIMESDNENYMNSSKKKNRKKYFNIKLNKLIGSKDFSNNKEIKKNNIYLNNIIYNKDELIAKEKENDLIKSINSYKTIKNNLLCSSNIELEKTGEFIVNREQFSLNKINKKVQNNNSFIKKYFCFFIDNNFHKSNCFISKIRYNKSNMTLYELPLKKVCYYSKIRKIFAKKLPKIEFCYFNKDFIQNNKNKNLVKNINNNYTEEDNLIINNEFLLSKKDNNENSNLKFTSHQHSFTSVNSNENNYFEISFGKKINKPILNLNNDNNIKHNLNTHGIVSKKNSTKEVNIEEENTNNLDYKDNKFLNDNINISPSKKYLNQKSSDNYLKKTEEGLKLLEKIAGNRISPTTNKTKSIFVNYDFKVNNIKGKKSNFKIEKLNNVSKKLNEIFIKKNNEEKNNSISKKGEQNNKIKSDFIELLNIITINNYDILLNKISDLILNNNIATIDHISNLYINQNVLIDIIINKSMIEKKFIKIYSKLCKDLFSALTIVIDNYNDDIDVFNKITKDKSLKVIIKNKIFQKLDQFHFSQESLFGQGNKNYLERDPFYCDLKTRFTGLINFIGELLNGKLLSQKTGFEILDILYKKYIKGINNLTIYNDLYLEGIEILLSKMKKIVYEKNNPEHIQRYNKFIKNYLSNILKERSEKNDLAKYIYYKIYNLIEEQKNMEEMKKREKVKTFVCYKKRSKYNSLKINDKNEFFDKNNNNNNSFTILENKYNSIGDEFYNINNNIFIQKENGENNIMEIMKKDIEKILFDSNYNEIKYNLFKEINKKYNEELNIKKCIEIWEIFYSFIEICIDIINSEDKIYIINEYIENIINNFALELSNENWEMLHYKLISLFLNINEICADNIYMYQIMGNLLFLLIKNKLFFIKDLNNFLNKNNEIIINIAKVVKYTIIFADKDAKKFHNDFKQTKLFIGNENFYNIVTVPLNKKFLNI